MTNKNPVYLSVCHVNSLLRVLKRLHVAYIPKERTPSFINADYPMYLTMTGTEGVVYLSYGDKCRPRYKFPSIGVVDDDTRQG